MIMSCCCPCEEGNDIHSGSKDPARLNEYEKLSEKCCDDIPTCSRNVNVKEKGKKTKVGDEKCPRKDYLAKLEFSDDPDEIKRILMQVENGEITTTAELIFCLKPLVEDRGKALIEILERDLAFFRKLVDEVVDSRVQDEGDVMHCTQISIKEKFSRLTESMNERTARIKKRLHEISPKFDWANDGIDRDKLSALIVIKRREITSDDDAVENLIHQIFIRGQWLKRELYRLQEENNNLKGFLEKSKKLAIERKVQEVEVPRMLARELKILEKNLDKLKKIYNKNTEKINAYYVECSAHMNT